MHLYENNRSSIDLIKNIQVNKLLKYVNITAHYIRELVSRKQTSISHVISNEMITDCLSKLLTKDLFLRMRRQLGIVVRD